MNKPWYTHSNWTGKTPRTLSEAFGPYSTMKDTTVNYGNYLHWIPYVMMVIALILITLGFLMKG